MQVSAPLPAVISITEALPDARFPNFKGIMAAKKKPFETLTLADLGVDAGRTLRRRGRSCCASREAAALRPASKIVDEGDAGAEARRVPGRRTDWCEGRR